MVCPNCGRRNSAGATFCSRCRQRLPIATKLNDNHRRTVIVEPRGGGGGGALVLGVALLAGFLFIGGAAAIYLSNPPGNGPGTDVANGTHQPTLPIFVQPTATPSPIPTSSPTFILLPSDSPTISPTGPIGTATPQPVITPQASLTPRPTKSPSPTPVPVVAKFAWSQDGTSLNVTFSDRSTGGATQWQWDFGDGIGTSSDQNPSYTYLAYDEYVVTLTVTGPGGSNSKPKTINVQAPPCDEFGNPPGCIPTPPPSPAPPSS